MADNLKTHCAFTGHRPQKFPWKTDESDHRCTALRAALTREVKHLAASGVTDFYSGMAQGVDTWTALAVLDLRKMGEAVRLHCILPCEGQESGWKKADQVRYRDILAAADTIEYVKRGKDTTCMLDRNRRLVESAGILPAVYKGEQRGGTAATIRYAQKAERKIVYLNPELPEMLCREASTGQIRF